MTRDAFIRKIDEDHHLYDPITGEFIRTPLEDMIGIDMIHSFPWNAADGFNIQTIVPVLNKCKPSATSHGNEWIISILIMSSSGVRMLV